MRSEELLVPLLLVLTAGPGLAQERGHSATGFVPIAAKGPASAPVTIIEFFDFECPACAAATATLRDVLRAYPTEVRIVLKHDPLPNHPRAPLAHEAVLAAGEQGKFWEMHDLLFTNQTRLDMSDLVAYASQLDLDVARFTRALEARHYRPVVEQDVAESRAFGVTATPTFFVHGMKLVGAPSLATFKALVERQLGRGTAVDGISGEQTPGRAEPLDIGDAPVRGPASAGVTIVEFSDFQCPFCARTFPVLQEPLKSYPEQVKWVFKHLPLDIHAEAQLAHQAALAAAAQGKFWEMHDAIFADPQALKRDDLWRALGTWTSTRIAFSEISTETEEERRLLAIGRRRSASASTARRPSLSMARGSSGSDH